MEYKDYYKIMGVARDASQDEIKRSYRKLARKYHPDVSKAADAEARFKEVGEAYAVLRDPEKRASYDQLGKDWKSGQEFRPPPNWDAGFEFSGGPNAGADASAYSDFFESLFGRGFRTGEQSGRQSGFRARGEDHHARVIINVEDAYHGATRTITLQAPEVDDSGHMTMRRRDLKVSIPKGVSAGQRIRLAGQGSPGIGDAPAGDLYLEIAFDTHNLYTVDGKNVHIELPITPWEATLGAKVKVPTPAGTVDLTIPKGTGHGRKLRLKGRGIPGTPPGDLYVTTKLTLPPADNEVARKIYEEMEQKMNYNPRSNLGV